MTAGTPTPTRRGVLALLGTAATAGCGGLVPDLSGDRSTQLDGAELRALAGREAPTVPETVPVDIERAYLETAADRARELLAVAPAPLGPREVPNGAIRGKLVAMRERAERALSAAGSAPSRYEAVKSLRSARSDAGELSAAWRAIDADLTREALLDEAPAIRRDVRDFRDRWRYAGDDPVRAVLVHGVIERGVRRAVANASVDPEELRIEGENPVTVGELGGDLERARSLADDVAYLYDRYAGSLADADDLGPTIRSAAESAVGAVEARRRDLPEFDSDDPSASVGREIDGTPAAWALRELYDHASHTRAIGDARSRGQHAHAVLRAQEALARLGAFASLHGRVAEGERFAVESASDVEPIRSAAVRAVEAALSGSHPRLARRVATDLAAAIREADRELADVEDAIEPRWIARDVGRYLEAGAIARAVPAAAGRVATALDAAR